MKNKIIEITSRRKNSKSVSDKVKKEFDLGDILIPPIDIEEIKKPKANKIKEIELRNSSLNLIPLEAKGALWKVEIPSKNAILSCNHLKGDSQFELCSNGNTYLFKEIHEVFDFLLSNKKEANQK